MRVDPRRDLPGRIWGRPSRRLVELGGLASLGDQSPSAMNDNSTIIVILSERSLPAVAGESKDLYLPRLARTRHGFAP